MVDSRELIENHLETAQSNEELKTGLEQIPRTDLSTHAHVWAKALLEKNPDDFLSIYRHGLVTHQHQDLIMELLDAVEIHEQARFTDLLFEKLQDADYVNQRLRDLMQSGLTDESIKTTLKTMFMPVKGRWESKSYLKLDDETALALYKRLGDFILPLFRRCLTYSPEQPEGYTETLQAIEDKQGRDTSYYQMFRFITNEAQYHRELRLVLDNPPEKNVGGFLWNLRPNHYQKFDIPEDIVDAMLKKFKQDAEWFLRQTSAWYGAIIIHQTMLDGNHVDVLRILNQLRYSNPGAIKATEAEWVKYAYDHAPAYFEKFLKYNLKDKAIIRVVLPLAKDRGQLDLYQHLYGRLATAKEWHQAITDILSQAKSPGEIVYELDWIDIPDNTIRLSDELAVQLYRKHPLMFQEFIRRHAGVTNARSFDYPLLKEAMTARDDDSWWAIFREVATVRLWEESLQDLLNQDIAPEQIAEELEKRHPAKIKPPTTALRPFLDRYGEAVLPYLEKRIKMLTEKRLKQLLSLDIDRAELRRELEKLSRRQPGDFQQMIHIWLPAIYDPESNFPGYAHSTEFILAFTGKSWFG